MADLRSSTRLVRWSREGAAAAGHGVLSARAWPAAPRRAPALFNAVNFFIADVAGGLGPFLPAWLASALHWQPERIGFVLTVGGIAGLVCNTPGGALVDRFGRPRLMIGAGSALILLGTVVLVSGRSPLFVLFGLLLTSIGGSVIGPAIAAASLAYVGQRDFPLQQGTNAAWSNAGNVTAALLIFAGAAKLGADAAVLVLGVMAAATIAALPCLARPGGETRRIGLPAAAKPEPAFKAFRHRPVLLFALTLLFFHLGNAAMLSLLGLRLAHLGHGNATQWMSACVVVAQFAMIGVALVAGAIAERYGKVPLFLFACAVLVVRGIVAAYGEAPFWLVPVEILDALGAGTLGVITPPLVADLSWGSGRTQTTLGAVMTAQGIGASLSSSLGGTLIARIGWRFAFVGLALPPIAAFVIALALLPAANHA